MMVKSASRPTGCLTCLLGQPPAPWHRTSPQAHPASSGSACPSCPTGHRWPGSDCSLRLPRGNPAHWEREEGVTVGSNASLDLLLTHNPGSGEGIRQPGKVGVKRGFPEVGSQGGPGGRRAPTGLRSSPSRSLNGGVGPGASGAGLCEKRRVYWRTWRGQG